jgi:hypothetical protein
VLLRKTTFPVNGVGPEKKRKKINPCRSCGSANRVGENTAGRKRTLLSPADSTIS